MSEPIPREHRYKVSVHVQEEGSGALIFEFVPKSRSHESDQGGVPRPQQQFIVSVSEKPQDSGKLEYDWGQFPRQSW